MTTKPYDTSANGKNVNIAIAINELTSNDASVGVIWAGTIPYYSDRKAIDFLGKSDRYIAHLPPDMAGPSWNGMTTVPGHNKYDLYYSIIKLKPTYIQVSKWAHHDVSQWVELNYVEVEYKDIDLLLLKDSPLVHWDRINLR